MPTCRPMLFFCKPFSCKSCQGIAIRMFSKEAVLQFWNAIEHCSPSDLLKTRSAIGIGCFMKVGCFLSTTPFAGGRNHFDCDWHVQQESPNKKLRPTWTSPGRGKLLAIDIGAFMHWKNKELFGTSWWQLDLVDNETFATLHKQRTLVCRGSFCNSCNTAHAYSS